LHDISSALLLFEKPISEKKEKKKKKKSKVGALIPGLQSTKAPHMQPPQPRRITRLISLPTWFVDVFEDPTQSSLTSKLVEQEFAVEDHSWTHERKGGVDDVHPKSNIT
jgi:hypothetical protein